MYQSPNKLVQVHWIGRLGNRMFQYAFGCQIARNIGGHLYMPSPWEGNRLFKPYARARIIDDVKLRTGVNHSHPKRDTLQFRKEQVQKYIQRRGDHTLTWTEFREKEVMRAPMNVCYDNLHMMYFPWLFRQMDPVFVRSIFQFSDYVKSLPIYHHWESRKGTYVVAHVRRGDIAGKSFKGAQSCVSVESYRRAFQKYGVDEGEVIWVSDDPTLDTAKNPTSKFRKKRWTYPQGEPVRDDIGFDFLPDFLALYFARTIFRGNSGFSWWAAMLGCATQVYSPVLGARKTCKGQHFLECDFEASNLPHFMGCQSEGFHPIRMHKQLVAVFAVHISSSRQLRLLQHTLGHLLGASLDHLVVVYSMSNPTLDPSQACRASCQGAPATVHWVHDAKNQAEDCGKYVRGIQYTQEQNIMYHMLTLLNDSVIALQSLESTWQTLREDNQHDLLGMVDSQEIRYHYQSWWLTMRPSVVQEWMRGVRLDKYSRARSIQLNEVGLCHALIQKYPASALCPVPPQFTGNIFYHDDALLRRCIRRGTLPFLKRRKVQMELAKGRLLTIPPSIRPVVQYHALDGEYTHLGTVKFPNGKLVRVCLDRIHPAQMKTGSPVRVDGKHEGILQGVHKYTLPPHTHEVLTIDIPWYRRVHRLAGDPVQHYLAEGIHRGLLCHPRQITKYFPPPLTRVHGHLVTHQGRTSSVNQFQQQWMQVPQLEAQGLRVGRVGLDARKETLVVLTSSSDEIAADILGGLELHDVNLCLCHVRDVPHPRSCALLEKVSSMICSFVNAGNDIVPFKVALEAALPHCDRTQYVLKLHTKRDSSYRERMVAPFQHGGLKRQVQHLRTHPEVPGVAPVVSPPDGFNLHLLGKCLGHEVHPGATFAAGTMFLYRWSALQRIFSSKAFQQLYHPCMVVGAYYDNLHVYDNSPVHALERLMGYALTTSSTSLGVQIVKGTKVTHSGVALVLHMRCVGCVLDMKSKYPLMFHGDHHR